MNVDQVIEHEDGSSTIVVKMTNDEVRVIMENALRIGLIKGLQMANDEAVKEIE